MNKDMYTYLGMDGWMDGCEDTFVDARDVRTNTPNPGTGILLGSVGSDVMLSMASKIGTKRQ